MNAPPELEALSLKRLLKHAAIYGTGTILSRAVGFFLIPIYTRYLVPDDYGALTIIDLLITIVTIFVGTGLGAAMARFYYSYKGERDRAEVIATATFASLATTALAAAGLALFAAPIAEVLLKDAARAGWIVLALASYVLNANVELGFSYLRTEQRSTLFTAIVLARLALQVALNVYLLVGRELGVAGYLWSSVFSGAAILAYLLAYTIRRTGLVFSLAKLRELAVYSVPLVPAALGMFVQNFADRFVLEHVAGLAAVGIYSLGYKFGMMISELVVQPFLRIWGVSRFEAVEEAGPESAREMMTKVFTYYVLALAFFWVGVSALIDAVVRVLAAPEYREAARYVPWITLGYAVRGLSYFYEGGAYIRKRPGIIALSNVCFAAFNMALNLALIPTFHAGGATAATLLTFLGQAWYLERKNRQLFPFVTEGARIARILGAAAAAFAIARAFRFETLAYEAAWALGAVLLFPALLTVTGFWNEGERGAALRAWRRFSGGPARSVTASS